MEETTFVTEIESMGVELLDYLQSGASFVAEQTPLVLQEILAYYFVYHLIWVGVCVIPLIAFALCLRRFVKTYADLTFDSRENWGFALAFGAVGTCAAQIGTLMNLFAAVKIAVAPRLYLIEYVSNLFKHN